MKQAVVPSAARLELARSVLHDAERARAERPGLVSPASGAAPRMLPVAAWLRALLPAGGLRRGSTVAVSGSTSLLLALLADASAAGSWNAVVGRPDLGLVAAAEAGVDLARLALVPNPGLELVGVVAALLDGVDLVAVAGVQRLRAADRQRLAARARSRGSVLLPLGRWPGADVELCCAGGRWHGLGPGAGPDVGPGAGRNLAGGGRLRSRTVLVHVRGRGVAARGPDIELLLPDRLDRPDWPDGSDGSERPELDRPAVPHLSWEDDAPNATCRWEKPRQVRAAG